MPFQLDSSFAPCGDQPQAIEALFRGIQERKSSQVLLGITGSGKTFTMANVIEKVQRPTLIIAHNKTLAAQLYQEFLSFFPSNAVEYFVSYYDYYQPEAYVAKTDSYIEKEMAINEQIERFRSSATRSLIERDDVIIVASVSAIYGLGSPEYYEKMKLALKVGESQDYNRLLLHLVAMHYRRNDFDFPRGSFRVRGDVIDIFPTYEEKLAIRLTLWGEEIESLSLIDSLTGEIVEEREEIALYPGSHHVTPKEIRGKAVDSIEKELEERVKVLEKTHQLLEAQRLEQRTRHDIELIREMGSCKGIENYSRHFSQRAVGMPPPCLLDYFPPSFLLFVDESHQTLPQIRAMANGDRARKDSLVSHGFRLPCAYDNRPLTFDEFLALTKQVVYVSATPGEWEIKRAKGQIIEQIIRPTGLLDPHIDVYPASSQVRHVLEEIRQCSKEGWRVLVTTLTKRLAEELTDYLTAISIRAQYLHSDVDTLERIFILDQLRKGEIDVLIGVNLLREGLDLPEVALVAILDADKPGFLRSETALIQTCGRAARNCSGRVIMYGDAITPAMKTTIALTQERRKKQQQYNETHHITPKTVKKASLSSPLVMGKQEVKAERAEEKKALSSLVSLQQQQQEAEKQMELAAKKRDFEKAAYWRDEYNALTEQIQLVQVGSL